MEPDRVHAILEENRQLKARIAELEKRLGAPPGGSEPGDSTQVHKVLKLLEQRDRTLEEIALELQQKKTELEDAVLQLEQRNEQLQLWIVTLGLYQRLMDEDPAVLLGFNRNARLIFFNRSAVALFGEDLRNVRLREAAEIDFTAVDPETPRLVQSVLETRKPLSGLHRAEGRTIQTHAFPVGSSEDPEGVLVRITVA